MFARYTIGARNTGNNDKYAGADPGFDQGGAPDRDRPKTAILGPQFCRILVLGPHFWWSGGGPGPPGPPLDPPLSMCGLEMVKYYHVTLG